MSTLSIGDVVEAEVRRVEAYGLYLQSGDNEIIVLIPDVSKEPVRDLSSRYRRGDRVRVRILANVPERGLFKATIRDVDSR